METKEVQGTVVKQTAAKGVKRKSTTELIIKEYNPTRKKGEGGARTRQDKRRRSEDMVEADNLNNEASLRLRESKDIMVGRVMQVYMIQIHYVL